MLQLELDLISLLLSYKFDFMIEISEPVSRRKLHVRFASITKISTRHPLASFILKMNPAFGSAGLPETPFEALAFR